MTTTVSTTAEGEQPVTNHRPYLKSQNLQLGVALAGMATFLWATTGSFIDHLITAYHLTPTEVSTWRGLLVTPVLALFILFKRREAFALSRREIPYYILFAVVGISIFNLVWAVSVEINKAAVATALIFSAPAFVALGARLLFHEKLKWGQIGAIGLNLLGCALVVGINDPGVVMQNPAGMLVGLASGITFAAYTLFGKGAARLGRRSSTTILFYTFMFGTVALVAWSLAAEGTGFLALPMDLWGWLILIVLSVGPTLGGYILFTNSLRYLPAAVASLCTTMEPPIAALLALLFLGRAMTGLQWLGTGFIVGGVVLMQALSFQWRKNQNKLD